MANKFGLFVDEDHSKLPTLYWLLLNNLNDMNCGHVRKCVMRSIIFWTIYPDLCNLITLDLSITNGIVSSKIYDKRDDFNFEIVNFLFLDGDVPRSPSYGVYIFQLIRFARVCSNVDDFNNRNLFLTAKLLKLGYR